MVSDSTSQRPSLPQYGFGVDCDFDNLIRDNHFLFRVYTPKSRPFIDDDDVPYFVAPKFDDKFARSPEEITAPRLDRHSNAVPVVGTYDDVVKHMDWTTRHSSMYISTSFSFIWSIWEALRRYHVGVKKDIEIAVIDAAALTGKALTAVHLLRAGSPGERRREHWKWYRYAQESQSVLVHECIPASAVFASIPLLLLIEKLPAYFLQSDTSDATKRYPLLDVAWDYTEKKPNYRKFCQDMSNRFLQLSPEKRLQATTAGSVRLAMAFLRSWFRRQVIEDFQAAAVTLCSLSFTIAQWPGQWWAHEHKELWNLIRAMALSVAEEVRALQQKNNSTEELNVLQMKVVELEAAVEQYKNQISTRQSKKPALLLTSPLVSPPLQTATTMGTSSSSWVFISSSDIASEAPRYTPILSSRTTAPLEFSDTLDSLSVSYTTMPLNEEDSIRDLSLTEKLLPAALATSDSWDELQAQFPPSSPTETLVHFPTTEAANNFDSPLGARISTLVLANSRLVPPPVVDNEEHRRMEERWRPSPIAETASCLVTGFLIGAFITLSFLSPHRRTLLTHLT